MFENMFEKALKLEKSSTMVYARVKKVHKDTLFFTPPMLQISDFGG